MCTPQVSEGSDRIQLSSLIFTQPPAFPWPCSWLPKVKDAPYNRQCGLNFHLLKSDREHAGNTDLKSRAIIPIISVLEFC